jgi:hypothetical protein
MNVKDGMETLKFPCRFVVHIVYKRLAECSECIDKHLPFGVQRTLWLCIKAKIPIYAKNNREKIVNLTKIADSY